MILATTRSVGVTFGLLGLQRLVRLVGVGAWKMVVRLVGVGDCWVVRLVGVGGCWAQRQRSHPLVFERLPTH